MFTYYRVELLVLLVIDPAVDHSTLVLKWKSVPSSKKGANAKRKTLFFLAPIGNGKVIR